ncbi:MAG: inorganic phosphate transporter [Flammeovirgaceae bacterium]
MITFQIIIGILVVLAIADLIVGVSNDAVNFLNSAVGSKAASFKTILLIASIGVLVGTLSSNGMMQVARNGIFQPEFFTFDKVMIIFLAVMLTDVILLDVYNTFGLPTSTTVSLIFELLGASFAVGVLYLIERDQSLFELGNILNIKSALVIIGGIFFSVFVAFVMGTSIHFLTRFVFTFRLNKTLRRYGPFFTGISATVILYFLLIKGVEGSRLASQQVLAWIRDNTSFLLAFSFVFVTALTAFAGRVWKFNPLRMIVLLGTFSLAMAFAGNDLVNFIGVSVAAYTSYSAWSGSQVAPDQFNMEVLNEHVSTPPLFLLSAGAIMVLTLWLSAKSRKVTETEVSLGRQTEGDEKFKPSILSRWLVGGAIFLGAYAGRRLPSQFKESLDKRLKKKSKRHQIHGDASFDLLRASVNLIVSSALIAYGTANQLPLSTTFVTFMVAMGSSFADQAWGRESAVYRVSGVIQVVAGWVVTALVAFAGSSLVAIFLYFTGFIGVIGLSVFTFGLLIYSQILFKRTLRKQVVVEGFLKTSDNTLVEMLNQSKLKAAENLRQGQRLISVSFQALLEEKSDRLRQQSKEMSKMDDENKRINDKIIKYIRSTEREGLVLGRLNLQVFDALQDVFQSVDLIANICREHVSNFHSRPNDTFQQTLLEIERKSNKFGSTVERAIRNLDFSQSVDEHEQYQELIRYLQQNLDLEVSRIQQGMLSNRLAQLQTRILLEMTDVIESFHLLYQLYQDFSKVQKNENLFPASI